MKSVVFGILAGAAVAVAAIPAQAQEESTNRVAVETDWNVFVEDDPKSCWITSIPKETVNTRDGRVVAVRRGAIQFFITYIPDQSVAGQVSFTGGYSFRDGSTVEVDVGGNKFLLFTVENDDPDTPIKDDEFAWAPSAEDDAKLIVAMKRGAEAVVTAVSARGTTTKDTFSLLGFTAALEEAENRCK